jgi:fructose-bisphosphate aldolase class II
VRTDPDEAASFVKATGVDALAVAVGTSHAMVQRTAAPDFDLITRLRAAVPVPLVLHGSSGVGDANLADHPAEVDTRKYLAPGRAAMAQEAARLLCLLRPDEHSRRKSSCEHPDISRSRSAWALWPAP